MKIRSASWWEFGIIIASVNAFQWIKRQWANLWVVIIVLVVCSCTPQATMAPELQVSYTNNTLTISNGLFERSFSCDTSGQVCFFDPISWYDHQAGREILAEDNRNWFELCVNGTLIRSEDGGWKYRDYALRTLENGGIEVVVSLEGQASVSEVHNRTELRYTLQFFPGSTVIRERMEVLPKAGGNIHLTKLDDEIRLVFPRYNFKITDTRHLKFQETRLAGWQKEILPEMDWRVHPNDRLQLKGGSSGRNLAQNHMYHPDRRVSETLGNDGIGAVKGPIAIMVDELAATGLLLAYEHGSPDDDPSQNYLAMDFALADKQTLTGQVRAVNGAYIDGEQLSPDKPYPTVWVDAGFFNGKTLNQGEAVFWNFLYRHQSEHLASRNPTIYYNTWGLQRDEQMDTGIRPQEVLTEARILVEIDYANQLGVDVFVIDDGWQNCFGDWQPHPDRLPGGFGTIKSRLDGYGIRMGLWFAAEGIDPDSRLYHEHPEFLARNADGLEITGRWNQPIGCFSSGYKEYFTELCKHWIDQGVTYFKWDGLDKHPCYATDHRHGDVSTEPAERASRSGYDLILAVTDVARELTEYNPEVVIVYDVTEELRHVGLAFLSEARFFWMNNGATWYGDFSYYRSKSIRSVANRFNQILPTVLQTSANYPHQSDLFGAQAYNLNTTLLGGGGFWGDLSEMSYEDRETVGEVVRFWKRVAPTVVSIRPTVTGTIGSSPEVYEFIDPQKGEGVVIAFSSRAMRTDYRTVSVNPDSFLCVLRNAYQLTDDGSIDLPLQFPQPDATCEAFIISNPRFPARIESSTCWLQQAETSASRTLTYINGAPGTQTVFWSNKLGKPQISSDQADEIKSRVDRAGTGYRITVEERVPQLTVRITATR